MNIYPYGQCTWWCADRQPWVMRYGNLGNAFDWNVNWRKDGGNVSYTPQVGDVACFQPGVDGADLAFGHVAVVVAIGSGRFTVSEMNGPAGPGRTDDRSCGLNPGVSFLTESVPAPPAPPPPAGAAKMWLYQLTSGTTFQVCGNTRVPLGTPADIQYLLSKGAPLVLEKDLSPIYAANLAKLPIV